MRIVTKINLALAAVVGVSALLNFAALQFTVIPSFRSLENDTAERNQIRATEAIEVQKDVLANSARDWAFWDDTYEFMHGERPDFVEKNVESGSLDSLGVNYMLIISPTGEVVLNEGYLYSDGEPVPIRLSKTDKIPDGHPWRQPFESPSARSGLVWTDQGIAVVGYAPVLTSKKTGDAAGTLVFGKLLDVEALNAATKVDFSLLPATAATPATEAIRGSQTVEIRTVLTGIDGLPSATLASTTGREITAVGDQAVWAAMVLLLLSGVVLVASLAFVLRRIAVRRIEAIRAHLVQIASTGNIEPIPADQRADELSQTINSFNDMAAQLSELREKLRRQDYSHGAADQAAGILHNVRNALSPIGAIAWDLARAEDLPWKQNLAKALEQGNASSVDPERAEKLQQFISLSAAKLLDEGQSRKADLQALSGVIRHVEEILKDADAASRSERTIETIEIRAAAAAAAQLIANKTNATMVSDLPAGATILGHRIVLEQVLGNLLVNAVDAIDSSGKPGGTIRLAASETLLGDMPALDITIKDDGEGIASDHLEAIFEKGFSTRGRRSSGLGLHWCANTINAMGGRLYAESAGAGHGATLHLILPCADREMEKAA